MEINSTEKKICFVISPIGESGSNTRKRADQVLKHVIKPIAQIFGYEVVRADTISDPGAITHQIIDYIIKSDLVVADLTGQNPNVYYELAIRHLIRKPFVQICDIETPLPFDLKNQRTIMFDYKDLDSVADAKDSLKKSIETVNGGTGKIMTPIHEGLAIDGLLESESSSDQLLGNLYEMVSGLSNRIETLDRRLRKGSNVASNVIHTNIKPPLNQFTIDDQIRLSKHDEEFAKMLEKNSSKLNKVVESISL